VIIKLLKSETMAKKDHFWKEKSRSNWYTTLEEPQQLPDEKIQLGCLMRIADATEAMAKNYTDLQVQLEKYKILARRNAERAESLEYQLRTLRGVVTRFRNERDKLRAELAATSNSTQNPAQ
jgi:predicted  nucleic acid-binding Zn-ribbon protein